MNTEVVVTGVSRVNDPGHSYRFVDAVGTWAGGTTRDEQVPLGRLTSGAVLRGMSGAPVRRVADDVVVGVVSGRYNSADGWLRDSVWVARTESLQPLLTGVAEVAVGGQLPLGEVVELVLTVSGTHVRLCGAGVDVSAAMVGSARDWPPPFTMCTAPGPGHPTMCAPGQTPSRHRSRLWRCRCAGPVS